MNMTIFLYLTFLPINYNSIETSRTVKIEKLRNKITKLDYKFENKTTKPRELVKKMSLFREVQQVLSKLLSFVS